MPWHDLGVGDDPVLEALDELVEVGRSNVVAWMGVMARVDEVRALRSQGIAYTDMSLAEGVSIIEAVGTNQERLTAAAARFRRVSVKQLHDDGMAPAAIARAFGVSRQRVAALLSEDSHPENAATAIDT